MRLALWLAQQEPVETSLTWPEIATGAAALVLVASGLAGGLIWVVRAVVHRETAPVRQQVTGTNGTTLVAMVEHTRDKVDGIDNRLDLVASVADENRALARSAQALAEHTASRLDEHLLGHGQGKEE